MMLGPGPAAVVACLLRLYASIEEDWPNIWFPFSTHTPRQVIFDM